MCGNYEQKQYGMAHGSLAGMIVKSESLTGRAGVAGSSSPSATNTATTTGSTTHNSAKMGSRRIFTPQFKLQVLDSYRNDGDCKGNQRATARKYGIHRRQIQKWLQVETNLRSVVANGGGSSTSSNTNTTSNSAGGTGSTSSGVVSGHGNGVGASSNGNSGSAAMKINLLNHPHHPHLHHPAHHVHHPAHHHLHYQPMHHHHPHHHPGLTGLMQAPSVAAALHYHHQHHLHQQQQQQQQQPVHPLAFHPIAVPPVQQPVGLDVVRQRVARNGASAAGLLSPVLTHTGATSAAIPVSSCSPLSVASSTGSLSSSSLCSAASPNSMARRSPSSHQLLQLSDAASSGGDSAHQPHHQQSVIFSPVPLLAAASATPSLTTGTTDSHYYGHIRALAATAQAAAAAAVTAAAATTAHRYDHPIDLSRPGSQSPAPSAAKTPYEYDRLVKEEQLEGEEEEISVEEVDEQPFERVVEQAWDLSCRRSAAVPTPDRKRSSSAMSGPIVTPDTSRPAKSVKLFKPYLLDEEEPEQKAPKQQQHQRPDSALADDDKDSTRESPAIVDRPMSPAIVGSHRQQQYPIIWSNSSPVAATAAHYELSTPAYLLASPPQTTLTAGAPVGTGVPAGRGWSSPQASPVSGYDSSTSISSVCSGPEEDNASHSSHSSSSHSHHQHGQSEKLRQQAIDSFYHDVACRGDYRAVATKYNINRKYVEKWLQQEQEDDHQHHQHRHHAEVRSPLVV